MNSGFIFFLIHVVLALLMAYLGYVCIDRKRYAAHRKMMSEISGNQIKLTDTSYKAARLLGFVLFIFAGGFVVFGYLASISLK